MYRQSVDKRRTDGRRYAEYFLLSVNWNNAHVVTGEYLAILELFILSADRKNQTLALRITYCSFLKRTQS